jgi:sulfur relay (sulfurtransferase) DsrF/TusC family protein
MFINKAVIQLLDSENSKLIQLSNIGYMFTSFVLTVLFKAFKKYGMLHEFACHANLRIIPILAYMLPKQALEIFFFWTRV